MSVLPKSAATIAEILLENGYSTAAFGKWHLTPEWEQSPQVGPFDHWPMGMRFQHFYGFIDADRDGGKPGSGGRVTLSVDGHPIFSFLVHFLAAGRSSISMDGSE